MNFVDSHCHMDSFEERTGIGFKSWWNSADPKPDAIIQVACEEADFAYAKNLSDEFPQVYAAYGVHPINAESYSAEAEKRLLELWSDPKTVGIGEIGLDYHYEGASRERQREVFARQLEIGKPFRKAFVLHLREAEADSLDVLRNARINGTTLHVHSCTALQASMSALPEFSHSRTRRAFAKRPPGSRSKGSCSKRTLPTSPRFRSAESRAMPG